MEMQIKTAWRFDLTLVLMAIFTKKKAASSAENAGKEEVLPLLVGMKAGPTNMETCMEVSQNTKNRTCM
jgi:hypothetical protein